MIEYKNGQLTISGFEGMGQSILSDFALMQHCNNSDYPGCVTVNFEAELQTPSVVTSNPLAISKDVDNGHYYIFQASTGATLKRLTLGSGATDVSGDSSTLCTGGIVWKNWAFSFKSTTIDVYGDLTGSAAWSNSWQTGLNNEGTRPVIHSIDDRVYFGNGKYVGFIQEKDGQTFAAGTSASYTFNATAVDLPDGFTVRALADLGDWLLIGANGADNRSYVFPWNRFDASFEQPVKLQSGDFRAIVSHGGKAYCFVGNGDIYITDGVDAIHVASLPKHILSLSSTATAIVYPNAVFADQDKIYFFVSTNGTNSPAGVYSLNTKNFKIVHETIISTGAIGEDGNVFGGVLYPVGVNDYLIGWEDVDAGSSGVDRVNRTTGLETGYPTIIQTGLISVGSIVDPKTFQNMQIQTLNSLSGSGADGWRIGYREKDSGAFTTINTVTGADGTFNSYEIDVPLVDLKDVQFQIELNSDGTQAPILKYIKFT